MKPLTFAVIVDNHSLMIAYIPRFIYTTNEYPVVLGITVGMISLVVLLTPQQSLAYNKFGFDNQTQCVNVTNLEFQGGFFDHATHMKLLGMCEHRPDATNATGQ